MGTILYASLDHFPEFKKKEKKFIIVFVNKYLWSAHSCSKQWKKMKKQTITIKRVRCWNGAFNNQLCGEGQPTVPAWGWRETSSKKRGMKKGTRNSQGLTSSWSFLKYLLSVLSIPSPPTNPRWDPGPSFAGELSGAPGTFNADK